MARITFIQDPASSKSHFPGPSRVNSKRLEDDNLTILDLESIVLTGEIIERQHGQKTDETKHIVNGRTLEGHEAETVVKIGFSGTLIFITVYVV